VGGRKASEKEEGGGEMRGGSDIDLTFYVHSCRCRKGKRGRGRGGGEGGEMGGKQGKNAQSDRALPAFINRSQNEKRKRKWLRGGGGGKGGKGERIFPLRNRSSIVSLQRIGGPRKKKGEKGEGSADIHFVLF